ncbi:DUF7178 family protein [Mycobacteroides franklinii]|uniref:DUF7178 family protein n=1 Tax=Mycobacteroides franklinii TaxID=948102 RepID=UPI0013E8D479
MSKNRKSDSLSVDEMADRLYSLWQSAAPWQHDAGTRWYDSARQWVIEAAERHNVSNEVVAGVIAAYSPQTRWVDNLRDAEYHLAGSPLRSGVMGSNVRRAAAVIEQGLDGLGNGPKVKAFARNILGDTDAVTVDVWAARAAFGTMDKAIAAQMIAWVGAYDKVADAYRKAAAHAGVPASVMQATVWVAIRGKAE